ncbi:hypothetical protein EDB83DRAFT_2656029, partial [Lactarius deliciosus]
MGNVVGLLDITKVFHEAWTRSSAVHPSEKLYSALAGVQSELGAGLGANPRLQPCSPTSKHCVRRLPCPILRPSRARVPSAVVGPRATVRDVARLMRERRTTTVCVMEPTTTPSSHPRIAGIFTSKDVVLRVIAAGLDASMCSVVRAPFSDPPMAAVLFW